MQSDSNLNIIAKWLFILPFVLLGIVAITLLFPRFYWDSREFVPVESNAAPQLINGVPLNLSIAPQRKRYYWFFFYCVESGGPYSVEVMVSPSPGETEVAFPYVIKNAMLQIGDSPFFDLIDQEIPAASLTSYNWRRATRLPIPEFEFVDGASVELKLKLIDMKGHIQNVTHQYTGVHETARACLAQQ